MAVRNSGQPGQPREPGLLGAPTVTDDSARPLAAGLGAAGALNLTAIGTFLNIAIAIAASLLFLGLLLLKIAVSVSTLLLFVGMPMAIVAGRWRPGCASRCARSPCASSFRGAVLRRVGGGQRKRAELQRRRRLMDKLLPLVAIVLLG